MKYLLIPLIGQLGIGNGHFPHEAAQQGLFACARSGLEACRSSGVDGGVNAADEKTRNAGDLPHIATARCERFQARDVGLGHACVYLLCEEQGNVDVDPRADKLFDGGDAFQRGRDFDHQILTPNGLPEPCGFLDRPCGMVCQVRGDFQTDVAVAPLRLVIDGPQHIGGVLDIMYRQVLVERHGVALVLPQRFQGLFVVRAARDGFLEDGRIRGDAPYAILVHQTL